MSEPTTDGLFEPLLARGPVATAVGDRAWLTAMLEVEAALARAEARVGLIPDEVAEAIGRACRADAFDPTEIGRRAVASGNPVLPLVEALRGAVGPAAAAHVHYGATSQDILDSAAMLVAGRASAALLVDLDGAADAAAGLADAQRATVLVARTLLQQAAPTTFGAKAAVWLTGLDAASERLATVRRERLAAQLGGPAGTLATLGPAGPAVVAAFAGELGLAEPVGPWHTERTRIADLAGALGSAAGAIAKPALDLVLLAQTEVAEVVDRTPGRGGSSSLPHKRNPIAAVLARAGAAQAPGLVANLLAAAGSAEQERAAGAWHAEWVPLNELFRAVGSAAAWLRDALEHVELDPVRMRANLELTGLFDDVGYLGTAELFVERALAGHAARRRTDR
jgi:3-carboxy-cis,cis-muconate cycloisomerase